MSAVVNGYTKVKNELIRDPSIDVWSFRVLCYLASYTSSTHTAWPSQTRIARETGISRNQVIRCLRQLEEQDYIGSEYEQGKWTIYWLEPTAIFLVGRMVQLETEEG